ncbi:hypothetical protein M2132_001210 [Dysgonomonas sp. PH5-45]|uniref:hypothetical protein n=1 Tax=unclassified Dysgonomonas TaxID=2630389 RepID=UPI0024770B42|nr:MULTISPECIES: hypothetical protein [unclassified Dysgonomonas]MDH6354877.1 hypothetical protein [Dysgonomonas sp. PH5-45]MDH6387776.1 hypothetical protein [Dysgonomonas sp. PH5-37]
MNQILKKGIINNILAKIPAHLNPVDFLQDALNLSKESVYRRIKGEVSFSLTDIIKLSSVLSFTLEEIITDNDEASDPPPVTFNFRSNEMLEPQKTFSEILLAYVTDKEKLTKAKNVEVTVASNRLMILTSVYFDHLFKFYYYKWTQQTQQVSLNFSLSDIVLPQDIIELREKLKTVSTVGLHTYILDINFLKSTIQAIEYYYKRKLISEDEVVLLQKDLYAFIDIMEYTIKQKTDFGNVTNIYLSTAQIESSGLYCKCDDEEKISLWISFGVTISSKSPEICKTYKSWLNSLKKYSSLITGCNEALQTEFIDQQRNFIKNITTDNSHAANE